VPFHAGEGGGTLARSHSSDQSERPVFSPKNEWVKETRTGVARGRREGRGGPASVVRLARTGMAVGRSVSDDD
jgi:hypothetical protein